MPEAAAFNEDRRQYPRFRLEARARMRPNEWSSIQIELVDISSEGFRGQCDAILKIGSCVTLEVQGVGLVEAIIVWRKGDEIGARFANSIDLDHCAWVREPAANGDFSPKGESLAQLLARRAARRATEL